jgi:hypothetical protein
MDSAVWFAAVRMSPGFVVGVAGVSEPLRTKIMAMIITASTPNPAKIPINTFLFIISPQLSGTCLIVPFFLREISPVSFWVSCY